MVSSGMAPPSNQHHASNAYGTTHDAVGKYVSIASFDLPFKSLKQHKVHKMGMANFRVAYILAIVHIKQGNWVTFPLLYISDNFLLYGKLDIKSKEKMDRRDVNLLDSHYLLLLLAILRF